MKSNCLCELNFGELIETLVDLKLKETMEEFTKNDVRFFRRDLYINYGSNIRGDLTLEVEVVIPFKTRSNEISNFEIKNKFESIIDKKLCILFNCKLQFLKTGELKHNSKIDEIEFIFSKNNLNKIELAMNNCNCEECKYDKTL